jgi:hypothetical protein
MLYTAKVVPTVVNKVVTCDNIFARSLLYVDGFRTHVVHSKSCPNGGEYIKWLPVTIYLPGPSCM